MVRVNLCFFQIGKMKYSLALHRRFSMSIVQVFRDDECVGSITLSNDNPEQEYNFLQEAFDYVNSRQKPIRKDAEISGT